ncbi:unnamed protein product [Amoebophrya sp. A25]|nr:unnamed protein product [Amoebophrya sp. A25]|eukprot:GSA25T00004456001.1
MISEAKSPDGAGSELYARVAKIVADHPEWGPSQVAKEASANKEAVKRMLKKIKVENEYEQVAQQVSNKSNTTKDERQGSTATSATNTTAPEAASGTISKPQNQKAQNTESRASRGSNGQGSIVKTEPGASGFAPNARAKDEQQESLPEEEFEEIDADEDRHRQRGGQAPPQQLITPQRLEDLKLRALMLAQVEEDATASRAMAAARHAAAGDGSPQQGFRVSSSEELHQRAGAILRVLLTWEQDRKHGATIEELDAKFEQLLEMVGGQGSPSEGDTSSPTASSPDSSPRSRAALVRRRLLESESPAGTATRGGSTSTGGGGSAAAQSGVRAAGARSLAYPTATSRHMPEGGAAAESPSHSTARAGSSSSSSSSSTSRGNNTTNNEAQQRSYLRLGGVARVRNVPGRPDLDGCRALTIVPVELGDDSSPDYRGNRTSVSRGGHHLPSVLWEVFIPAAGEELHLPPEQLSPCDDWLMDWVGRDNKRLEEQEQPSAAKKRIVSKREEAGGSNSKPSSTSTSPSPTPGASATDKEEPLATTRGDKFLPTVSSALQAVALEWEGILNQRADIKMKIPPVGKRNEGEAAPPVDVDDDADNSTTAPEDNSVCGDPLGQSAASSSCSTTASGSSSASARSSSNSTSSSTRSTGGLVVATDEMQRESLAPDESSGRKITTGGAFTDRGGSTPGGLKKTLEDGTLQQVSSCREDTVAPLPPGVPKLHVKEVLCEFSSEILKNWMMRKLVTNCDEEPATSSTAVPDLPIATGRYLLFVYLNSFGHGLLLDFYKQCESTSSSGIKRVKVLRPRSDGREGDVERTLLAAHCQIDLFKPESLELTEQLAAKNRSTKSMPQEKAVVLDRHTRSEKYQEQDQEFEQPLRDQVQEQRFYPVVRQPSESIEFQFRVFQTFGYSVGELLNLDPNEQQFFRWQQTREWVDFFTDLSDMQVTLHELIEHVLTEQALQFFQRAPTCIRALRAKPKFRVRPPAISSFTGSVNNFLEYEALAATKQEPPTRRASSSSSASSSTSTCTPSSTTSLSSKTKDQQEHSRELMAKAASREAFTVKEIFDEPGLTSENELYASDPDEDELEEDASPASSTASPVAGAAVRASQPSSSNFNSSSSTQEAREAQRRARHQRRRRRIMRQAERICRLCDVLLDCQLTMDPEETEELDERITEFARNRMTMNHSYGQHKAAPPPVCKIFVCRRQDRERLLGVRLPREDLREDAPQTAICVFRIPYQYMQHLWHRSNRRFHAELGPETFVRALYHYHAAYLAGRNCGTKLQLFRVEED